MPVNLSEQIRRYSQRPVVRLPAPLRALGGHSGEHSEDGGVEQIIDKAIEALGQSRELLAYADKLLSRRW